ncbi:FadR/GntR family transcriptional regulator [Dactylosporangium sp. CA-233914]|uniref:FadR/GntR family transcriptional regulator n=1 Tax=Dactylosporangium sp. CA-233914 TaxID=3239934 RepID=UPI003D91A6CD
MAEQPSLSPIRQIAAHELVVDQIRRSMDRGQFRPGDRLPPERDLAEMLDVSRTTVRSAIAVLEREGRISVRRGRSGGFLVLEPTYDAAEARRELRRNKVAVHNAFEFRVIVETAAARLAAQRRRTKDLPPLSDLVSRMSDMIAEAKQTPSTALITEFQHLDSAFHLGVARASGNDQLVEAVTHARSRMWIPVGAIFGRIEDNANDHHADILTAIRNKEADLAAATMAAHINETRQTIESWLNR